MFSSNFCGEFSVLLPDIALHSEVQSSALVMPVRRFPSMQNFFFSFMTPPLRAQTPIQKPFVSFYVYLLSYLVLRRLAALEALGVLS